MARLRRRLLAAATATAATLALGVVARAEARDYHREQSAVAVAAGAAPGDAATRPAGRDREAKPAPAAMASAGIRIGVGESRVDLLELLRGLCPKLNTATGAQRCLSLLTAVFNSPQCVARLLAATVVTMSSLLFALGSMACLSILGPALVRLATLYNCVKAHHSLGACLSRPPARARPLDG